MNSIASPHRASASSNPTEQVKSVQLVNFIAQSVEEKQYLIATLTNNGSQIGEDEGVGMHLIEEVDVGWMIMRSSRGVLLIN
jgi:hypothetical protein